MSTVGLDEVTVSLGGWFRQAKPVLDSLDLSLQPGTTTGLVGPNGAGKTTAMLCLLGFVEPEAGNVQLLGEPPRRGGSTFESVVYLPEEPSYPEYLTLEETLHWYRDLYREPDGWPPEKALNYYELTPEADQRLGHCSKGTKQRLGLAALTLIESQVIFLDEPTRGLDPLGVESFRRWLDEETPDDQTVLINSHVMSDVEQFCDRVAFIRNGSVVAHDRLEALLEGNRESYRLHVRGQADWPDMLRTVRETDRATTLDTATEDLSEAIRWCQEHELPVNGVEPVGETLEEAFERIIREDGHA